MKDVMDLARKVNGLDRETISNELFELVKKDKEWLGNIVKEYCDYLSPDIETIKRLVHDYQNPIHLDDETNENDLKD